MVETAPALGLLLSVKDGSEVDSIKRAAILTNKVWCCAVRRGVGLDRVGMGRDGL